MNKKLKYLITSILIIVFALGLSVSANAQQGDGTVAEYDAQTVFDKLYCELGEYAGEILCAMAFAGSVILAFAYKKGLLPIVKGSLVSIGNAVGKMKDSVNQSTEMGEKLSKSLESGLDNATEMLRTLGEKVDSLEHILAEKLTDEDERAKEKEALGIIMNSQIDMLYDIFMCSALPQYQKDAVGEKIAKMKEALAENGDRG